MKRYKVTFGYEITMIVTSPNKEAVKASAWAAFNNINIKSIRPKVRVKIIKEA